MARLGKIARLSREIREEINRRILDGKFGIEIIAWLNSLPKVQAVLKRHFDGRQINPQNLSEWRKRGYRDWEIENSTAKILEKSTTTVPGFKRLPVKRQKEIRQEVEIFIRNYLNENWPGKIESKVCNLSQGLPPWMPLGNFMDCPNKTKMNPPGIK